MTPIELSSFMESASIAFSSIGELVAKTPAVVSVWSRTLHGITYEEAVEVLDRWIMGTLSNPPSFYRRDSFALDVRAVVAFRRSEWLRQKEQFEQQEKRDRRKQPSAAFRSIAKPFNEILALRAKVMAGELSAVDCEWQVKAIVDGAFV